MSSNLEMVFKDPDGQSSEVITTHEQYSTVRDYSSCELLTLSQFEQKKAKSSSQGMAKCNGMRSQRRRNLLYQVMRFIPTYSRRQESCIVR
jgi:hypothetical protein